MKNFRPSKGFIFTLSCIFLIVVTAKYLMWNYRSCMEVAENIILKAHPEFISVRQFDDQGDEIYFRAMPKENDGTQYVIETTMQCNFTGGVAAIGIGNISHYKNRFELIK